MGNQNCKVNGFHENDIEHDFIEETSLINFQSLGLPMVDNHFFNESINPKNHFGNLEPDAEITNFADHIIYKAKDDSARKYLVRFFQFNPFTPQSQRLIDFKYVIADMKLREAIKNSETKVNSLLLTDLGSKFETSYNIYGIKGYTRIMVNQFVSCSLKEIIKARNSISNEYTHDQILFLLEQICEWLITIHSLGYSSLSHYMDRIFWSNEEIKILNTITIPYVNGKPDVNVNEIYDPISIACIPEIATKENDSINLEKADVYILGLLALSLIELEYDPYVFAYTNYDEVKRKVNNANIHHKWIYKLLSEMLNSNPKQRINLALINKFLKTIKKQSEISSFNFEERTYCEWKTLPLQMLNDNKRVGRRSTLYLDKFEIKHIISKISFYCKIGNITKAKEVLEDFSHSINNAFPQIIFENGMGILSIAPYLIQFKQTYEEFSKVFSFIKSFDKVEGFVISDINRIIEMKISIFESYHHYFNNNFEESANLLNEISDSIKSIKLTQNSTEEKQISAFYFAGKFCHSAVNGLVSEIPLLIKEFKNHFEGSTDPVQDLDFNFVLCKIKIYLGEFSECSKMLNSISNLYSSTIDSHCLERFQSIVLWADAEINQGKITIAIKKLIESVEEAKLYYGETNSVILNMLYEVGILSFDSGDCVNAKEYFNKVIILSQDSEKGFNNLYQYSLVNLISISLDSYDIDEALSNQVLLESSITEFGAKGSLKLINILLRARLNFFQGNFKECQTNLENVEIEISKYKSDKSPEIMILTAYYVNTKALLKLVIGTKIVQDELIKDFEICISNVALYIPIIHPEAVRLKLSLAKILSEIGNSTTAERLIFECFQATKKYMSKDNFFFHISELNKLNLKFSLLGPSKFIKNYEYIFNLFSKYLKDDCIFHSIYNNNLAIAKYQDSHIKEAIKSIKLAIKQTQKTKYPLFNLILRNNHAAMEIWNYKFSLANSILEDCLKDHLELELSDSPFLAIIRNNYGVSQFFNKNLDVCYENLDTSISLKKQFFEFGHSRVLNSLYNLCLFKSAVEVELIVERFLEESKEKYLDNDLILADIYLTISYVLINKHSLKEAEKFQTQALEIYTNYPQNSYFKIGILNKLKEFYIKHEMKNIRNKSSKKEEIELYEEENSIKFNS